MEARAGPQQRGPPPEVRTKAGQAIGRSLCREPVTAIRWQYSTEEAARHSGSAEAFRVITLASDGRVLVWLWHRAQVPVLG